MKMLVCTDGSENSRRAIEEAIKISGGCNVVSVSVINVLESYNYLQAWRSSHDGTEDFLKRLKELDDLERKAREDILAEAAKMFTEKGIKVETILEEGHPAETIAKVVEERGYDTVVIGCRGLGGLKSKLFGSVCNAVTQKVHANIIIVKD